MDGFVTVKYKGRKKKKDFGKHISSQNLDSVIPVDDFDSVKCKKCIDDYKLRNSKFWLQFLEIFYHSMKCTKFLQPCDETYENIEQKHHYEEIVLYGIGSISNSHISKYQLAFSCLFKDQIKIPCYFYEPVLSKEEKKVISSFGFEEIPENEECKRLAEKPSIFLMLHCGKAMYNNLLWKNWSLENLQNLCIIGNSFTNYTERVPSRILKESSFYLHNIITYTTEHSVGNTFIHQDIFNDTSIHTFKEPGLSQIPHDVFLSNEEPQVSADDVEIIKNNS